MDDHCSVLIKLSEDGQKLFAGHDTWGGFTGMLRVWKNYYFPFQHNSTQAPSSSFSSYPGVIPSGDDYYLTSQKLAIVETTNEVMNQSLYQFTTIKTVPYWIRIVVANRMATSGAEWVDVFGLYNSGTYNNQWMIVDYKLFTPGQPLQPGTFWVAEQIPGYLVSGDQTSVLQNAGYWASYNIPYYTFVYDISGYPAFYAKYGNSYSYTMCARAQIFRRDEANVQTFSDYKKIMRYNEYQTDPLSLQDACRGISARCDLNPPWASNPLNTYFPPFGGMDSKVTEFSMAQEMITEAVCGPTWDSQAVFAWTNQFPEAAFPRYGHPSFFAFHHVKMQGKW